VAHSSGQDFGCNIGALGGVLKWATQMVDIFCAILANLVRCLSGPSVATVATNVFQIN
jgi:hypothetical protein